MRSSSGGTYLQGVVPGCVGRRQRGTRTQQSVSLLQPAARHAIGSQDLMHGYSCSLCRILPQVILDTLTRTGPRQWLPLLHSAAHSEGPST
jgi:hypothetical protein